MNSLLYSSSLISDEVRIEHDIDNTMSVISTRLQNEAVTKATFEALRNAMSENSSTRHLKSMLEKWFQAYVEERCSTPTCSKLTHTDAIELQADTPEKITPIINSVLYLAPLINKNQIKYIF